jgi:citrate lyase subunit beta / citryl-CoA lyase
MKPPAPSQPPRPLRSLLSTPGSRPEMLDKAPRYGADAIVIDLEDAVPAERKAAARDTARAYVERYRRDGVTTYVKVNGLGTGLLADDLDAITVAGLDGIQLPKVDAPEEIKAVDRLLTRLESARGLAPGSVDLMPCLESAIGVYRAYPILTAAARVRSVMVAAAAQGDLQRDLGFVSTETEEELLYVRSSVLLAARAAGVATPIDGVYADLSRPDGLEASARRARQIGYRGKKVIHPRQVEIVNRAFSLRPEERDYYTRVIAAMEAAYREGRATALVDGKMVDTAMAETARSELRWSAPEGG